jgi:hypothetical protein
MIEENARAAVDQRNASTWRNYGVEYDYTVPQNAFNVCLRAHYENAWDTMDELAQEEGFDTWDVLYGPEELFEIFRQTVIETAREEGVSLAGTWLLHYGKKSREHIPLITSDVPGMYAFMARSRPRIRDKRR